MSFLGQKKKNLMSFIHVDTSLFLVNNLSFGVYKVFNLHSSHVKVEEPEDLTNVEVNFSSFLFIGEAAFR